LTLQLFVFITPHPLATDMIDQ